MRIFLAGATGAIGSQLVPLLIAAGHDVAGLTRRQEKATSLHAVGATPVVCDLYDAQLAAEVANFAPDVVVHQVTDLPSNQSLIPLKLLSINRARRKGTDILIRAAREAGATRFVAQSIAFKVPGIVQDAVDHLEKQTLAYPGVVLRYGVFYGPGTWTPERPEVPVAVHIVDAAARTVAHLDAAPGVYTFTDADT